MNTVKAALTRKVGFGKAKAPAWVLILVLAAGAYWYYKRQAAASSTVGSPAAATTTAADTTAYDPGSATGSGDGGSGGTTTPTSPDQQTAPASFDPNGPLGTELQDLTAAINNFQAPPPATPTSTTTTPPAGGGRTKTAPSSGTVPVAAGTNVLSPQGKPEAAPAGAQVVAEPPSASLPGPNLSILIPSGDTLIKRTAAGVVEYSTPTGAIIEQAPGQSRYTVSAAPGKAAAPAPAAPVAAVVAAKPRTVAAAAPSRTAASAVQKAAPAPAKATVAPTRTGPAKAS